MPRMFCWNITAAMLALALLLPGCGSKKKKAKADEETPRSTQETTPSLLPKNLNPGIPKNLPVVGRTITAQALNQFAILYQASDRPPRRLEDMPELDRDMTKMAQAIRNGEVIVNWGLRPGIDNGETILAYLKDVPTQGGLVVLLNGSTPTLTPEQFKASSRPGAAGIRPQPAPMRK